MKRITPTTRVGIGALTLVAAVSVWVACRTSDVGATPPPPPPPLPEVPPMDAGVSQVPTTAQIVFNTIPPVEATVSWGKKKLGKITPRQPLVVTRPRDSGPLDVIVRAEGYLPVQTRAHTFSDSKVTVKLTPPDQMSTLLGYRVPLDAGVPISLDALPSGFDGGLFEQP